MGFRRLVIAMELLFFVLFGWVFYMQLNTFDEQMAKERIHEAKLENLAIKMYNREHQKTAIAKLVKEKVLPENFFNIELISSSHMTKVIHDNLHKLKELEGLTDRTLVKDVSTNPMNPDNRANRFERDMIEKLKKSHQKSFFEKVKIDGLDYYADATLQINDQSCMQCHGDPADAPKSLVQRYGENGFHEKVGQIRALHIVYTPLDVFTKQKDIFFWTVMSLVAFLLLISYVIIHFFSKELEKKNKRLLSQSKFASMGKMSQSIITQWREPLSLLSSRIESMRMDYEFESVDSKKHQENLEKCAQIVASFTQSIEKFKTLYAPDQESGCVKLETLVVEVEQVLHSDFVLQNIDFSSHVNASHQFHIAENLLFITLLELLRVCLNVAKTFQSGGVISINAYAEEKYELIEIDFKINHALMKMEHNFYETYGIDVISLLVQEQLRGSLSIKQEAEGFKATVTLPLQSCKV